MSDKPAPPLPTNIGDFFPLPTIRNKQEKAIQYIQRMVAAGVEDIIISAPTGVGKSAIGLTAGFWGSQAVFPVDGATGAYYLCTQKLLQDQLEKDTMGVGVNSAVSLKSATAYECPKHGNCGAGLHHKPTCAQFRQKNCTYTKQVSSFLRADVGITNYPYLFTEHTYLGNFPQRRFLIADECHTLENQILQFVEVKIGPEELDKFASKFSEVPVFDDWEQFLDWCRNEYLPVLQTRLEGAEKDNMTAKQAREHQELVSHAGRVSNVIGDFENNPDNWVFWCEEDTKPGPAPFGKITAYAKPISAEHYFDELIRDMGSTRIYMSAYPGSKDVFCRSLGIDPRRAAMLTLGSVFPVDHRPIHATLVGSMGRNSQEQTLPVLLKLIEKILKVHGGEKGIIHCNSYAIGNAIFNHFRDERILFPKRANERESVYKKHLESPNPTVILSPSFTEGFDFVDGMARWQVIAKMPFPYLGDRQVAAKKERDPEWYAMKTVMTVIQASGRICRNETDYGTTYIADGDFQRLYERYEYMFPRWWTEALHWSRK